jgi:TRAP transporter TAXI family solute receptor
MGNGSIEAYTIIGNFITKDYPNLILRPQETPGYLYNIREMATNKRRWKNTTFGSGETIINLAFTGGGSKALREFLPLKIDVQWKALWSTATSSAGLWYVTFDPDLKTVSDLKGKKIGLGLRTQSEFGMNAAFFLDQAYGINSSNTKIFFLGPMKMTNSLLDGKVDAICMGMVAANSAGIKRWLPSPPYLKLVASKRKLNYIPMDEWAITKINNRYGTTYQSETVKAGMLKDLTSDLKIGGNRLLTVVHPTFSDDLAYKYIMALANTAPKIKEYHPFWKYIWNLEGMVSGLSEENTHPGAIRAYKELGVWDKRHNYPPFDLANATRK